MPNKPRPENRHRMVRVEDDLWEAAKVAAADQGTTVSAVMREALRELADRTWVVTYEDVALHLTYAEYDRLKRATYDHPRAAKRMADYFLARETRTPIRANDNDVV